MDISFDSYDEHMEKQVQTVKQIYMANVIITGYALQLLYEDNPNSRVEDWMLLSFTHSEESQDMYIIEWTIGIESCNDYSSYR